MKLGYLLFYVDDVTASMDFYEKAFSLTKGFLHDSQEYGEMISGETKLGFVHHNTAESHNFKYRKSSLAETPAAFEIGLVTEDVPAAYAKALAAGAVSASAPATKPWGQTVAYVRDLNGFLVEICSPM